MNSRFRILIADRNRHVREFLRREFREDGFRAQVAKDVPEILMMIDVQDPPDLLILDLEAPDGDPLEILERLHAREPPLPVVIYSFFSEHSDKASLKRAAALVEKRADVDFLKKTVEKVLRIHYPDRLPAEAR